MSILENLVEPKLVGNVKRIKELDNIGLRPDAIVKTFNENNINISEGMVNVVLNGELDELRRKALPKSVVKEKSKEIQDVFDGDMLVA